MDIMNAVTKNMKSISGFIPGGTLLVGSVQQQRGGGWSTCRSAPPLRPSYGRGIELGRTLGGGKKEVQMEMGTSKIALREKNGKHRKKKKKQGKWEQKAN